MPPREPAKKKIEEILINSFSCKESISFNYTFAFLKSPCIMILSMKNIGAGNEFAYRAPCCGGEGCDC